MNGRDPSGRSVQDIYNDVQRSLAQHSFTRGSSGFSSGFCDSGGCTVTLHRGGSGLDNFGFGNPFGGFRDSGPSNPFGGFEGFSGPGGGGGFVPTSDPIDTSNITDNAQEEIAQSLCSIGRDGGGIGSVLGKVFNAPNSILGALYGLAGAGVGLITGSDPSIGIGNNAIEFSNNPFVGRNTALTIGNVAIHNGSPGDILNEQTGITFGQHERQHTFQGQVLGPAYLPANIAGSAYSLATTGNQFENNPLEAGPYGNPNPPTPFGCGN